jgi:hypothetical protein
MTDQLKGGLLVVDAQAAVVVQCGSVPYSQGQ